MAGLWAIRSRLAAYAAPLSAEDVDALGTEEGMPWEEYVAQQRAAP